MRVAEPADLAVHGERAGQAVDPGLRRDQVDRGLGEGVPRQRVVGEPGHQMVEEVVSAAYGPDVAGRPPDGGETHRAANRDPAPFRLPRLPTHTRPQRGNSP